MKILKKIAVSIMIFLLFGSIVNGYIQVHSNNYDENYEIMTFNFSFDSPKFENVEYNNNIYTNVYIEDLPTQGYNNKPLLPVKPLKILIPYGRAIDHIEVTTGDKSIINLQNKIEKQHNIIKINNEENLLNTQDQENAESFILKYTYVGTHIFRGYKIAFINLYPINYDSINNQIITNKEMKLTITTKESDQKNIIRGLQRDKNVVESIVYNPSYLETYNKVYTEINDNTAQYIIITNEDLAESSNEYTFNTLINSKINKGVSAQLFTVEDILSNPEYSVNGTWGDNNPSNPFYQDDISSNTKLFDDVQAKIRNFIRYAYSELGTDYVLLGGDADVIVETDNIIPLRGLYACEEGLPLDPIIGTLSFEEDDIPSDIYYACLDGSFNMDMDNRWGENASNNNISYLEEADLLAEIYVGRACVDSEEEVSNFVMKTLSYENSEDPYLSKVLMVGEYLGFPGVSAYGGNYKEVVASLIPDNYNIENLFEREVEWYKSDLIDQINRAPPQIINHLGHGNQDYALKMKNKDILTLTNNKYFFLYSQTCLAGSFDNWKPYSEYQEEDCAAEHLTVETPYGAFAVIMNARYGLGSENSLYAPSQELDKSFFKALFTENIRDLGHANHYSKEDHIWHINENGIRWAYYETNLLGDPEIQIKDPYPSDVDIDVTLTKPDQNGALYLFNIKLLPIPLITTSVVIGSLTVTAEASSNPSDQVYSIYFYLDDELMFIDENFPFQWELYNNLMGKHKITAEAHGIHGEKIKTESNIYAVIINN